MMLRRALRASLTATTMFIAACGGTIVEPEGNGGAASTSTATSTSTTSTSTTSTSTTSTSTTSTSTSGCGDGCPPNSVCLWQSGTCAEVCAGPSGCGPGLVCNECATGSCPGCLDCVAACVPAQQGQCDDHDDCPAGSVCIYATKQCAPACDPSNGGCPSPGQVCDSCATSPCPFCAACMAACVGSE